MDGIPDDDDQIPDVHAERDAYVAGKNIYLTNNKSLVDELSKFGAVNSRMRAAMLSRYSKDDGTLQDATVLLMHAPLEAATGALRVLLERGGVEEDLALTLLDYVDESRMQDLIDLLTPALPFLESFPQALEAISGARKNTPQVGEETGRISRAWESARGTHGFCKDCKNGRIYWSINATHACYGAINAYYDGHRGSGGMLGFPLSTEDRAEPWAPSADSEVRKTEGRYQRFEGPSDYSDDTCARLNNGLKCGATVYWSEEFGAHATSGAIGEVYEQNSGTAGFLGFPVEDEIQVRSKTGTQALRQRFQGGVVYYRDTAGAIPVPYPIAACHGWDRRRDDARFPESPREEVGASNSSGTRGYRQRFERRVTVYESEHGVYIVGWGNRSCYDKMGGPDSWLGFPTSEELLISQSGGEPRSTVQEFEGGTIYYRDGRGSIPIPSTVLESIAEHGLLKQVGFPVAKDYPLGSSAVDRIYFFDRGIVTVLDGVVEAWVPPT